MSSLVAAHDIVRSGLQVGAADVVVLKILTVGWLVAVVALFATCTVRSVAGRWREQNDEAKRRASGSW